MPGSSACAGVGVPGGRQARTVLSASRPGVAQRRSRPVELTQPAQSGPADPGDSAAQCPAHQLAALAVRPEA
jgi:hypothetical protein